MWRSPKGHATLFILVTVVVITAYTLLTINQGIQIRQQMRLQLASDAAATSGAIWEARTYNLIAAMNQGILIAMAAAFIAAIILVGLIACASTVVGAAVCGSLLATLGKPLMNIITNAHEVAVELSDWERKIVKVAPLFPAGYAFYVGRANHAQITFPYPFIPETLGADHDDETTLTLHLKDGGYQAVIEKGMESILGDIPPTFRKLTGKALTYLDALMKNFPHPDPLVLDDDFRPRMKLGAVSHHRYPGETLGTITLSQATVFLPGVEFGEEDMFEMNWHVKLVPVDFHKDLPEKIAEILEHLVQFD